MSNINKTVTTTDDDQSESIRMHNRARGQTWDLRLENDGSNPADVTLVRSGVPTGRDDPAVASEDWSAVASFTVPAGAVVELEWAMQAVACGIVYASTNNGSPTDLGLLGGVTVARAASGVGTVRVSGQTGDAYTWVTVELPASRGLTWDFLVDNTDASNGVTSAAVTSGRAPAGRDSPGLSSSHWRQAAPEANTGSGAERVVDFDASARAMAVGVKSQSAGSPADYRIDAGGQ